MYKYLLIENLYNVGVLVVLYHMTIHAKIISNLQLYKSNQKIIKQNKNK